MTSGNARVIKARTLLLLALLGCQPAQAGEWDLDTLGQALSAAATPDPIAFTESRQLPYLSEPLVQTGTLLRPSPERLEKHVITPAREDFIIDGGQVTVIRADGGRLDLSIHDNPLLLALAYGLRGVLNGDMDGLQRAFTPALDGTAEDWTLILYPDDESLREAIHSVRVQGQNGQVQTIAIEETGGGGATLTLGTAAP